MIKVLVFGMTANPGGLESVVMNYYRHIDRQKVQFDFICYKDKPAYYEEIQQLGGHVYIMPGRRAGYLKNLNVLRTFFKEHASEYAAVWENANSLTDVSFLRLAKKHGIGRRIIHAHNSANMDQSFVTGALHILNKLSIEKLATDYWACSLTASEWMFTKNMINSPRHVVLSNAIDLERFKFDPTLRDELRQQYGVGNDLILGHIGRMQLQKNQLFLLDVFVEVHKKKPGSQLWMIGDGPDREKVLDGIKKRHLEDSVHVFGVVSNANEFYNAMDIFMLPSLFEGLAVVLVEAQANGLKCFVSDSVTKVSNLINNMDFISLSEPVERWAEKILNTPYDRIGNAVTILAEKGFSIGEEARKMEEFFLYGKEL